MKIATFNVNGIRARLHQLQRLTEKHHPDIIAVQEIKCVNDAFPHDAIREMGYHAEVFGQKGHYGVALLSKQKAVDVQFNFPQSEQQAQRRLIVGTYVDEQQRPIVIMNGYFPQGESRDHPEKFPAKQKFYADLTAYLTSDFKPSDNILIVGDMNVAPTDLDIGIGEQNARRWLKSGKCAFLPEEREWLQNLVDWGLLDLYRELKPQSNEWFSWFDYRSGGFEDSPKRGLRIDLVLGTATLHKRCLSAVIDYEIRGMEKPSDHTPVIVELS